MSKKTFDLIVGIVTGVEAISEAVTCFSIDDPILKGSIIASIPVIANGIIVVCSNFLKEDTEKKE